MPDIRLVLDEKIPRLMRYATALTRDPETAADLVEDTLREAIARGMAEHRDAELHAWLLTILHEQRDNPFRLASPAAGGHPSSRDPAAHPSLSRFDQALGRLPEERRAVILLIGLEGLSYDDTAAILGISVGAMRTRLLRGRESLARWMGAVEQRRPIRASRPARSRVSRAA